MKTAIVTGAYGGLGRLIVDQLEAADYTVHRWDAAYNEKHFSGRSTTKVDVADWFSVHEASYCGGLKKIDLLVNCAGYNKLEPIPTLMADAFDKHMAVNARGIFTCTQALLSKLADGGTVCNIISNASHMPMRMSLAYNASKAAAARITRQMARELWDTHRITVFGVSPNRLAGTPMSDDVDRQVAKVRDWWPSEVRRKQIEAMAIGEETDPAVLAEFIGFILSSKQRHKYLHGSILEYGI